MENNNEKKGLKVAVIILSILFVVFAGLFVYEKIFNKVEINCDSKLLDLSKLDKYKNFDNTYGVMKSLEYSDSETGTMYKINLGMDGKVYINNYSSRIYINGVKDIVDIISFNESAGIKGKQCYMLADNGDIYVYNLSDLINKKYDSIKLSNIDNVDRLIPYTYGPRENSSALWGLIAITKDGKYIELTRSGL